MVALIVGFLALLFREDFAYIKEAVCGVIAGASGANAGVWVLNHTLKRYPGRTIAWIYIVIVVPLLLLQFVGVTWILIDPAHTPTLRDYFSRNDAYFDFSSVGEAVAFYSLLIGPRTNFMRPEFGEDHDR